MMSENHDGKLFQPSLKFVSKAEAYPSGTFFRVLFLRVGSLPSHKD